MFICTALTIAIYLFSFLNALHQIIYLLRYLFLRCRKISSCDLGDMNGGGSSGGPPLHYIQVTILPCRVDVSPTDVSPTESSWMLRPLNKASLGYCVPDRCVPTPDRAPSAAIAALVGLRRLMDQWGVWPASPTPLTRFIGLAPLRRMHARPTHRTPPLRSANWKSGVASLNQIKGMGWFGQGPISQGTLCPRDATSKNFRSRTHRSGTD
jgi:hypothetical protein